jgi:hypothetical protein
VAQVSEIIENICMAARKKHFFSLVNNPSNLDMIYVSVYVLFSTCDYKFTGTSMSGPRLQRTYDRPI